MLQFQIFLLCSSMNPTTAAPSDGFLSILFKKLSSASCTLFDSRTTSCASSLLKEALGTGQVVCAPEYAALSFAINVGLL